MDLIKVSQLDPLSGVKEEDVVMIVRNLNGKLTSYKTTVRELIALAKFDYPKVIDSLPPLANPMGTDVIGTTRKVGTTVTSSKVTIDDLLKLAKFDFPKEVNSSQPLGAIDDKDIIAVVRNIDGSPSVMRKLTFGELKNQVGKVKTVQNFEPDENGNIQISRKDNFVAESSYLVLNLDPKNMIERYEASFTDPNKSVQIEVDLRSFTTVAYAKELLENYVAQLVLRNEIDAKGITLRFRNGPNGYVFYQGQKVLLNTNIFLTGKSNILEFRIASDKVLHVANLSGGGVETVNDVAPDSNNNVNVLTRAPFSNNNPVPNWKGIGNFATATRSCSISLASGRPANFDMIGWCFEILVDTSFLTAQQQLTVTIDPKDVIWPDGTPMSAVTAENLFIYEKGEINKIRFTYASSGKFIIEDGRLGSSSINNLVTGNATASAPVLNLYLNQLNLGGMGTLVYKPTQGVFTNAYFRLNKSNFIPSRIPTGWEFLFSVTMDKNSTWVENSIPVIMELGDSFEKLYDSQLRQVDRYKYITADRGVVKWYKLRYVRSVGFVVSREFVSSIPTVNGAEADPDTNNILVGKPVTNVTRDTGTTYTYKPTFKGVHDALRITPAAASMIVTVDLSFDAANPPPVGWTLEIDLDTDVAGAQGRVDTKFKTNTNTIINAQTDVVQTSTYIFSAAWGRKRYASVVYIGNGLFKVIDGYPGELFKFVQSVTAANGTFVCPCSALTEYIAVMAPSSGFPSHTVDLKNISSAPDGYRLFVYNEAAVNFTGATLTGAYGDVLPTDTMKLADYKWRTGLYELLKVGSRVYVRNVNYNTQPYYTELTHNGTETTITPDMSVWKSHKKIYANKGAVILDLASVPAQYISASNSTWEMILEIRGFTTSPLAELRVNAMNNAGFYFDGQYYQGTASGGSQLLLTRFLGPSARMYKVTVRDGAFYIETMNQINPNGTRTTAQGTGNTITPRLDADLDVQYIANDGGTTTINLKDFNPAKVSTSWKFKLFVLTNSNSNVIFDMGAGTIFWNGASVGKPTINVTGLTCFEVHNTGAGAPLLIKL